jgi:hypothetical protein
VFAAARELRVLIDERPGMCVWDASAWDGRVVVAPVTDVVSYFVCLHELGHLAGQPAGDVLEQEAFATAWAFANALVPPDRVTLAALSEAWVSHGGVRVETAL